MLVYMLNIALILVGGVFFLGILKGTFYKKIYFVLVSIQLSLVAGLRAVNIGIDTSNYAWIFESAPLMNLKYILGNETEVEKGYLILQNLVYKFSDDFNVFLTIGSLFFVYSVSRLIYKNSVECCLSFILFIGLGFYKFSMTGVRQTIAIGIILFSFEFIKKRKLIPFLLIVALASTFHFSAIVFLPIFFFAYKEITNIYVVLSAILIPLSFLLKGTIFSLLSLISGYGYDPYANEGPYVLLIMMITVFIGGFIQRESLIENNRDNLIFYNMSLISVVLAMLTFVNPSALRLAYYYHIYLILFIPQIIMSISDKKLRRIIYAISLTGIILLEVRALSSNPSLVPYMFFWQ